MFVRIAVIHIQSSHQPDDTENIPSTVPLQRTHFDTNFRNGSSYPALCPPRLYAEGILNGKLHGERLVEMVLAESLDAPVARRENK